MMWDTVDAYDVIKYQRLRNVQDTGIDGIIYTEGNRDLGWHSFDAQRWWTGKKPEMPSIRHSGESRNPVTSTTYKDPGPRFSTEWRLFTNESNLEYWFHKNIKQKDNLAKFSYDTAKIILAITVISPIAKPETFNFALFVGGFIVTILFFALGCLLDTKEVREWHILELHWSFWEFLL